MVKSRRIGVPRHVSRSALELKSRTVKRDESVWDVYAHKGPK
jgi:hypothetical protein